MQNSGPPYQGAGNTGVDYSDHAYDNQVNACPSNNYQNYVNAPYHPVVSPRPQHYGNRPMQQSMPYGHHGSYTANQNQYASSPNQDMYRNHHSTYVSGGSHNLPPKPVWTEGIHPEMMQQYNHMPSHRQIVNNASVNISSLRSPPHISPSVNPSPSPGAQHYKHHQSPGHSPHSWSQAQVPSPGILHSTRTTPSPLSTNSRSPGHSQPFSPPPSSAHSSAVNMSAHPVVSSGPENGQSFMQSNQDNSSNPLHSLQKMVMLDDDVKSNAFQMKCETANENCDHVTNIASNQVLSAHQNCDSEPKETSFSTYFNLDENRFESKPRSDICEHYVSASNTNPPVNCNYEVSPVLNNSVNIINNSSSCITSSDDQVKGETLSLHSDQTSEFTAAATTLTVSHSISGPQVLQKDPDPKCADSDDRLNVPSVCETSDETVTSVPTADTAENDVSNVICSSRLSSKSEDLPARDAVEEQNLCAVHPESANVETSISVTSDVKSNSSDSNTKSETEKSNECCDMDTKNPSTETANIIIHEQAMHDNLKDKDDVSSAEDTSQNSPNPVESPHETDNLDQHLSVTSVSNNTLDIEKYKKNVSEDKPDELLHKDDDAESAQNTLAAIVDKPDSQDAEFANPSEQSTDTSDMKEFVKNEADNPVSVDKKKIQIKKVKRLCSPTKSAKKCGILNIAKSRSLISNELTRNPVKVVIHRIRTNDTNDTWHVPQSNSNVIPTVNLHGSSQKSYDNDKDKATSKVSNIGPQIIILSPAMSRKKFGITSTSSSKSIAAIQKKSSIENIESKSIVAATASVRKKNVHNSPKRALSISNSKKRGRPAGSKNKLKSTIRKKRKLVAKHKNQSLSIEDAEILPKMRKVKVFGGPYIRILGPKQRPSSITVVNMPPKEEEKGNKNQKNSFGKVSGVQKQPRIGHTSTLSPHYDAFNCDKTWLCAFCHKGSHYHGLGDLYGPYFIKEAKPSVSSPSSQSTPSKEASNSQMSNRKTRRRRKSDVIQECTVSSPKKAKQTNKSGIIVRTMATQTPPTASSSLQQSFSDEESPNIASKEVWIHEDCAVWCAGVSLMGSNVQGLDEAIQEANNNVCSNCKLTGATVGCWSKSCKEQYHFSCAKDKGCKMDVEKFSLLCPKHKGIVQH